MQHEVSPQAVDGACHRFGATMIDFSSGSPVDVHAPITLQPLPMSKEALSQLKDIMPHWNRLIDAVAHDTAWLLETLRGSDAQFTGRLLDIFRRVYHERQPNEWGQRLMLGIFRSDYLISDFQRGQLSDAVVVHQTGHPFRQVEFNTISCAFPALSTRAGLVHQDTLGPYLDSGAKIEVSTSETDVISALRLAHDTWTKVACPDDVHKRCAVVFLVQENERNSGDQRLLANGLEAVGVRVLRRTLLQLANEMSVDSATKTATLHDGGDVFAITVFYLRSLYDVKDFVSEASWSAREAMELCNAIKCPSLPHHLCTWKRVQQALSDYTVLRRFCPTDDVAHALHHCMVKQFLINSDAAGDVVTKAIADPTAYVLKTQREGTGSLITGSRMQELLRVSAEHPDFAQIRNEHILMERIFSRRRPGKVMRRGEAFDFDDLECEIGTFGAILSDGSGAPLLNAYAGYLIRTKSGVVDGGGVMSGIAALDTISLQD